MMKKIAWLLLLLCPILLQGAEKPQKKLNFGFTLFNIQSINFDSESKFEFNLGLLEKHLVASQDRWYEALGGLDNFLSYIQFQCDPPRQPEHLDAVRKALAGLAADRLKPIHRKLLDLWLRMALLTQNPAPSPQSPGATDRGDRDASAREIENLLIELKELKDFRYLLLKAFLLHTAHAAGIEYFAQYRPLLDLEAARKGLAETREATAQDYFILAQVYIQFFKESHDEGILSQIVLLLEKAKVLDSRNYQLFSEVCDTYQALYQACLNQGAKKEIFWFEELLYKKIIELNPNHGPALNDLGFLYARFGVYPDLAVFYCRKAVEIDPKNSVFRDSLGWAYYRQRDFEKALAELKEAIQLDPKNFEPHYHLGTLHLTLQDLNQAELSLGRAVELAPGHADSLNNFAYLLTLRKKDLARARDLVTSALKLDPNNHAYLDTLGYVHYQAGEYDRAEKFLRRARELKPNIDEVAFHLGEVYLKTFQYALAREQFADTVKLNPAYPEAAEKLALACLLTAAAQAQNEFESFQKGLPAPATPPAVFTEIRSDLFKKFGDFDSASKILSHLTRGETELPVLVTPGPAPAPGSATLPLPSPDPPVLKTPDEKKESTPPTGDAPAPDVDPLPEIMPGDFPIPVTPR